MFYAVFNGKGAGVYQEEEEARKEAGRHLVRAFESSKDAMVYAVSGQHADGRDERLFVTAEVYTSSSFVLTRAHATCIIGVTLDETTKRMCGRALIFMGSGAASEAAVNDYDADVTAGMDPSSEDAKMATAFKTLYFLMMDLFGADQHGGVLPHWGQAVIAVGTKGVVRRLHTTKREKWGAYERGVRDMVPRRAVQLNETPCAATYLCWVAAENAKK